MVKKFYLFMSWAMFLLHIPTFGFILFGWLIPQIYLFYMVLLFITGCCYVFLGYCPLTKWEFYFRKKINPEIKYDYSFVSYYTYKWARQKVSIKFIRTVGIVFVWSSFFLNIGFKYFLNR